jgi:hypothetical protein
MIFTKEECNTIIEWDYKEWIRVSNFSELVDCGIIEKINKASASIHKKTLRGGANTIVINPVYRDIFLKNKYYSSHDNRLWGGRYKIEFNEFTNKDIICLYNDKIESEEFINTLNLTPNMMQKKKKDYLGIIKIKNIYI